MRGVTHLRTWLPAAPAGVSTHRLCARLVKRQHCLPASLPPSLRGRFDDVFDEAVDNNQLYNQAVQPLVGTFFRCARERVSWLLGAGESVQQ